MEIPEIKTRLTLAQVLQHYHLKPDKNLRLHCRFHEDKTPSLQVYYKTHTAFCFSANCKTQGKSMDVIDFVMHQENTDKHGALLKCAEIIHYYEGKTRHKVEGVGQEVPALLTINREAFLQNMFTYFKNAVHSSKPAQDYLKQQQNLTVKAQSNFIVPSLHNRSKKPAFKWQPLERFAGKHQRPTDERRRHHQASQHLLLKEKDKRSSKTSRAENLQKTQRLRHKHSQRR